MNVSILVIIFIIVFSVYFYNKYATVDDPTKLKVDLVSKIPNVPNKDCDLFKAIKECTTNSKCTACKCSDESALSGCMTCQTIDNNSTNYFSNFYVSLTKEACNDPYEWDYKEDQCRLKNGKYCLPTIMQDVYCNPHTTRKVLYDMGDGGYQWKCVCKKSTDFDQTLNSGGDCNKIMLCGLQGSTLNPDPRTQRGLYRVKEDGTPYECKGDDYCSLGDKCVNGKCYWQSGNATKPGSTWDPTTPYSNNRLKYACQCGPEEVYDSRGNCVPNKCPGGRQKCLKGNVNIDTCSVGQRFTGRDNNITCTDENTRGLDGSCPPGSTPSENECECPQSYIDCRSISYSQNKMTGGSYYNGICTVPSCIPDPCGPNGKFDPVSRNCICNTGYNVLLTPHNMVGQRCVKLCDDIYNPCGSGDQKRGECFVDNGVSTLFNIIGIVNGAGQDKDEYFYIRFPSENAYKYRFIISSNDTISVSDERDQSNPPTNAKFKIKPWCNPDFQPVDSTCPPLTEMLSINDSYYFMYGDKYVDFINKKLIPFPEDQIQKLLGSFRAFPSTGDWPTLIKLINLDKNLKQLESSKVKNSRNINSQFYVPNKDFYITITNNTTISTKTIYTTSRCGKELENAYKSKNPVVCNDGYYLGGKDNNKCVSRDYCDGYHIQDANYLCNGTPSTDCKYKPGFTAACKTKAGMNNCGINSYPICELGVGECKCSCQLFSDTWYANPDKERKDGSTNLNDYIKRQNESQYKNNILYQKGGNVKSFGDYVKFMDYLEKREKIDVQAADRWCPYYTNPNDNAYGNIKTMCPTAESCA